jgi:hypothetical protein
MRSEHVALTVLTSTAIVIPQLLMVYLTSLIVNSLFAASVLLASKIFPDALWNVFVQLSKTQGCFYLICTMQPPGSC